MAEQSQVDNTPAAKPHHDDTGIPGLGTGFSHLHLHTEYSLLDGGNRIDRLVSHVKELGMDSVAITDHGNLFGARVFYNTCKREGIKPILGCEAYVAPGDRTSRERTGVKDGGFHLVLLAENEQGWQNLMELASEAYLTGFYYKPRIDREILERLNSGLIAINGHLGSEIAYHTEKFSKSRSDADWQAAVEVCQWHERVFKDEGTGPRFFVELQHHIPEQNRINPDLIKLARERNLPIVCDNDSHFLKADEHDAHDTLICISTGQLKHDDTRLRYTPELYVKSAEQMHSIFGSADYNNDEFGDAGHQALDNTVRIAHRCNVELEVGNHAPVVAVKRLTDEYTTWDGNESRTDWFKRYCTRFELEPFDEANAKEGEGPSKDELKHVCDVALRELCEAGLVWRYGELAMRYPKAGSQEDCNAVREAWPADGEHTSDKDAQFMKDVHARLDRELGILRDKDISAYFLIVWDFVNWARQGGIPSLARGSGVGTMTGFLLGLSNACPVEYGLLFERFTDPDRSEYPDIDIDLCQDGRQDVINYVREKYGHVAQIITFGTLKARAGIRDIGRVYDIPLSHVDTLAKLVPEHPKMNFKRAMEEEPKLAGLYRGDYDTYKEIFKGAENAPDKQTIKRLIDTGMILEGQARHSSVHAAGVIVATRPLHEIAPLYKAPGTDDIVTQWDGPTCEEIGLLKMDFLGLRTLSIIERAVNLVREGLSDEEIKNAVARPGQDPASINIDPLDMEQITYDDPRVYELFKRADTTGVFQFESGGMRRLLSQMKPDRLGDLIAANALFRPGPMDLIPDYNARKHGQQDVPKVHEIVDGFTEETYGIMIYQEQVMQIVHELGGIPLRSAYTLIKAISKKKEKVINANRPVFVQGAEEKGLQADKAEELFDLILKFAGYGFNKSHSTGYAIVAYRTAYLKTFFPNQYMAAFLSYESQAQKVDDWIQYLDDCRKTIFPGKPADDTTTKGDKKVGVEVRPPDVNLSQSDFSVVFEEGELHDNLHGHVRFGLSAIKGVGRGAIQAVIAEREASGPFTSIHDFCERVPTKSINKSAIDSLVCCGAFDSVHGRDNRAAMAGSIESAVSAGQSLAKDKASGQNILFGAPAEDETDTATAAIPEVQLASVDPWDERESLKREKDTLGFYISAHPMDEHELDMKAMGDTSTISLKERPQESGVVLGGMVKSCRTVTTKKGDRMAILTIEDKVGTCDAVVFPRTYSDYAQHLTNDAIVFLMGQADHTRGDSQIIVDKVIPLEAAAAQLATRVDLCFDSARHNGSSMQSLETLRGEIARQHDPGAHRVPITLTVRANGVTATLEPMDGLRISPNAHLMDYLRAELGKENVRIKGGVKAKTREKYDRRGPQKKELGSKEMCESVNRS